MKLITMLLCAWVLWSATTKDRTDYWAPVYSYDSQRECRAGVPTSHPAAVRFLCLPVGVDPAPRTR
jgi:hypothetical protein